MGEKVTAARHYSPMKPLDCTYRAYMIEDWKAPSLDNTRDVFNEFAIVRFEVIAP